MSAAAIAHKSPITVFKCYYYLPIYMYETIMTVIDSIMPWCPCNAPVVICKFLKGCPWALPRRKYFCALALSKLKHTGQQIVVPASLARI